MAMPVPSIIFTTTQAGRDAAAFAFNNLPNGKLSLQTIKVGSGKYIPTGNETALQTPYANTFNIGGGGVQEASGQIRFSPIFSSNTRLEAFEIGLYSDTGVLFAIAATTGATPLLVVEADIEALLALSIALTGVNPLSVEVVVDVNAPLSLILMNQHVVAAHPHSQYKRTLDNTERLKVAPAVDDDDAIRKDEIDALRLRLIANGIDANLGVTNHIPNINVDSYLIPEGFFDENTLGDKPFTYGLCKTWKEDNGVVYQFAQSYEAGNFATRLYRYPAGWTLWRYYASLNGDANEFFNVKTATSDNHAPTFKQLVDGDNAEATARTNADLALSIAIAAEITNRQNGDGNLQTQINNLTLQIMSKAWPIGSVYENEVDMRNPAHEDLLGFGTWEATQVGLFSAGKASGYVDFDFDTLGHTGGARGHKMTLANLIAHNHTAPSSAGIGTSSGGIDTVQQSAGSETTSDTGNANPEPIPTLPPYVVSAKWRRTA